MTIASLRQSGLKVFVKHYRYYWTLQGRKIKFELLTRKEAFEKGLDVSQPESRGGQTEIEVYRGEHLITAGRAECSKQDNFNRRRAVNIALARAIKFSKESLV